MVIGVILGIVCLTFGVVIIIGSIITDHRERKNGLKNGLSLKNYSRRLFERKKRK